LLFTASGIAWVLCVPGQKHILVAPPTKTSEIGVKNGRKGAKEAKAKYLLFVTSVIFQSN